MEAPAVAAGLDEVSAATTGVDCSARSHNPAAMARHTMAATLQPMMRLPRPGESAVRLIRNCSSLDAGSPIPVLLSADTNCMSYAVDECTQQEVLPSPCP